MTLAGTRFIEATLRSPLLQIPVRSVVFQLATARVLLSPASTLTAGQLREAGPVTDIVAPSLTHTAGMKAAAEAYPAARLWGPAGVREKHPALAWHGLLGVDPWPFQSELELLVLPGLPKLNECAFLHHPSKALYLTDMVFNVAHPRGLLAWLFYSMFGVYRRFGVSKLFLRFVKDRAAFEAAVAKIAGLDFLHVIPSHGEALLNQGKPSLLAAFRERRLLA
jgi:hypothetical protein